MLRMLIASVTLLAALPASANAANSADRSRKAILVTGASTGIGRKSQGDWRRMGISSTPALARKPISSHLAP